MHAVRIHQRRLASGQRRQGDAIARSDRDRQRYQGRANIAQGNHAISYAHRRGGQIDSAGCSQIDIDALAQVIRGGECLRRSERRGETGQNRLRVQDIDVRIELRVRSAHGITVDPGRWRTEDSFLKIWHFMVRRFDRMSP
jgi:hypothetical protein